MMMIHRRATIRQSFAVFLYLWFNMCFLPIECDAVNYIVWPQMLLCVRISSLSHFVWSHTSLRFTVIVFILDSCSHHDCHYCTTLTEYVYVYGCCWFWFCYSALLLRTSLNLGPLFFYFIRSSTHSFIRSLFFILDMFFSVSFSILSLRNLKPNALGAHFIVHTHTKRKTHTYYRFIGIPSKSTLLFIVYISVLKWVRFCDRALRIELSLN